jgi:uncharacterized SAM-binding protein YcdF (DUF218 family)
MFFFLSKTVGVLFLPLTIVSTLLLLAVFLRKPHHRKTCLWAGVGLLLFFSNTFIANEAMLMWELPTKPYNILKQYEIGIVLTGTTQTRPYPNDRVYFNKGADRVTHTVELYKKGIIKKILISGGTGRLFGEDEPEANKYKKAMILMGVDTTHIFIENETRNTYESAIAVKPMLDSLGLKAENCVLITSAFHMRRSLACYRKAGVNLDYFTTDFYAFPRNYYFDAFLVPSADALIKWQKLFKEWLGMAAYKMAGYI